MNPTDKEFKAFAEVPELHPPAAISRQVRSEISRALNPSAAAVFARLSGIHLLAGTATLLICPQFGVSITGSHGIMHFLMQWGEMICSFLCGGIFVSASALVAGLVLRPEEVRVIRRNRLVQFAGLATLSLGAFVSLGASVVATLAAVWGMGSLVAGAVGLELGWLARNRAR